MLLVCQVMLELGASQLELQQQVRQIPAVAAEAVTQLQVKQAVQE